MSFSIVPYDGISPMRPWPSLGPSAFCLQDSTRPKETVFFYDSSPPNGGAPDVKPVFVLIHGLGDEADSWRHLIPLLNSRGYRTLAPDLPGFGRSVVAGNVSLKRYAGVVARLIQAAVRPPPGQPGEGAAPSRPPVFLAGSSMGALVAQKAALAMPGISQGMVLIGGSIPGGPKNPGPLALAKILFNRKWYRVYRKSPDGLWASLYPYYADLDALPAQDKEFLRQRIMARVESPAQERAFFAIQRSVVRAYLTASFWFARRTRRSKEKILLLWGESDRIIPLSSAKAFKSLREGIALQTIPGAGHLPQQENPAETGRLMLEFAAACHAAEGGRALPPLPIPRPCG